MFFIKDSSMHEQLILIHFSIDQAVSKNSK